MIYRGNATGAGTRLDVIAELLLESLAEPDPDPVVAQAAKPAGAKAKPKAKKKGAH